ncbi:hypothetical protein HDZ31DRAFT_40607 [Schizophyllum fasciatum]
MGKQPHHQAYLIAKVVPHGGGRARYRCIAALRHKPCYAPQPLRAVCRLLALLRQPGNAQIVQEELSSIQGKYGPFMKKPRAPARPCPFAAYLLNVAFNCDKDEVYAAAGSFAGMLDAKMGCWDGVDYEGISVVDVTDPAHAAYGFLGEGETARMLSAADYAGRYWEIDESLLQELHHDSDTVPDDIGLLLDQMKSVKVVSIFNVCEAWPRAFKASKRLKKVLEDRDRAARITTPSTEVPSLLSLTIGPAVKQIMDTGDFSYIEGILLQEDKLSQIISALREHPAPFPDHGVPLIKRIATEMGSIVDLSGMQLSAEQLIGVLTMDAYDEVNVSRNSQLTLKSLPRLLAALPPTRRLVLFGTSVMQKDMNKLLMDQSLFYWVQEVVHPATFCWTDENRAPDAFIVEVYQRAGGGMTLTPADNVVSMPLCSLAPIAQNLITLIELLPLSNNGRMFEFEWAMVMGDAALEALLGTALLPEGRSWAEREMWCTPCHPSRRVPASGGWEFLLEWDRYRPERAKYGFVLTMPDGSFGSEPLEEGQEAVPESDEEDDELEWEDEEPEGEASAGEEASADELEAARPTDVEPVDQSPPASSSPSVVQEEVTGKKATRPAVGFYAYDLPGFLARLAKDGKPPLPQELEARLKEVFEKLSGRARLLRYRDYRARRQDAAHKAALREYEYHRLE